MQAPIPSLQQPAPTVHSNAVHYGYCAFNDIIVADRQVQPDSSPYKSVLPARTLIPFVRIDEKDYNPAVCGHAPNSGAPAPPTMNKQTGKDYTVTTRSKSARECIDELIFAYNEWGLVRIDPLTGISEDDAGFIFYTIQPFRYALKDIQEALDTAEERINANAPYFVFYENEEYEMNPLPQELKATALKVLNILRQSVDIGVAKAQEITAKSEQNLEIFQATGKGKPVADALDRKMFAELGKKIPTRITSEVKADPVERLAQILAANQTAQSVPQSIIDKEKELDEKLAKVDAILAAAQEAPKGKKAPATV